MKLKLFPYLLTLGSLTLSLAGCGSGGTTPETKNVLEQSAHCISCHESGEGKNKVTPGTGVNVVNEWKHSTHMSANGAGCADCHDDGFGHAETPASCSKCHTITGQTRNPTKNPDRDDKCNKCHDRQAPTATDGYKKPFTDVHGTTINTSGTIVTKGVTYPVYMGVPLGVADKSSTHFVHFSTGKRSNYVSSNYKQNCRKCHNPHDTTFGREQRKMWAESGHGNTRGLARIAGDFKTRGTNIPLDQNVGNNNYCVRCHTSGGFINFIANDSFTDVNALPDTANNNFKTNAPEWQTDRNTGIIKYTVGTAFPIGTVYTYTDKSREATNCDVCHLDSNKASSYSGTLRKVALTTGVKIYYPYSSAGRPNKTKWVDQVQFDTLSNSNLCLTCHSGRATGATIKHPFMIANISSSKRPSAPSIHDFAGGAILQGEKSAFLFYTSPLKYKTTPDHRAISTDGNGPCVGCHMPKVQSNLTGGSIHSHLFRPVTWVNDDLNDNITDILSNATVCSTCHNGSYQSRIDATSMNDLRKGFRLSVLILGKLTSTNWYGLNRNVVPNIRYGMNLVPELGNFPAAIYTMGASFNQSLLLNEPSAYNHSPVLVRQLLYDSIDWLQNGRTNFGKNQASVYSAIINVPIPTAAQNAPTGFPVGTYPAGFLWNKKSPVSGAILGLTSGPNIADVNYNVFDTAADKFLAIEYLCKNYSKAYRTNPITRANECIRW